MLKIKNENYYGSDLNRFIDEFCSHRMDCINIDCVLVKVAKRRIRFIESKKLNERLPKSEIRVFSILKSITDQTKTPWKADFYIVYGNYPFTFVKVVDFETKLSRTLNQAELIRWLNFEKEIKRA